MPTENRNPQNAKPAGGRQPEANRAPQPGQAASGKGNEKGQKLAQQQGAAGTADQGGTPSRGAGLDQKGGVMPEDRDRGVDQSRRLRQGTVETEESED